MMEQGWKQLSELNESLLEMNLSALQENQPDLVPVLKDQKKREDILIQPHEKSFFLCKKQVEQDTIWIHSEKHVVHETQHACHELICHFDKGAWLVLVHHAGLGYAVHDTAIQLETKRRGEPKGLVVLERDAGLVCTALSLIDFTVPIRSGRILWVVGADYENTLVNLSKAHHLETLAPAQIQIYPPLQETPDHPSFSTLNQGLTSFWQTHQESRNAYLHRLEEAGQYWSRPAPSIRKVWTHFNTDRGGAEMMQGLLDGFQQAGLQTRSPMMMDRLFTRFYRIAYDFFTFQPDLILCQNHSSNYMASFAEQIPIPRIVWYVDDPANMAAIPFHPQDRVCCVSDRFVPEIEKRGKTVECILHAAAPGEMRPPPHNRSHRHCVSYVGSVTDNRHIFDQLPDDLCKWLERFIQDMLNYPMRMIPFSKAFKNIDKEAKTQFIEVLRHTIPKTRLMREDRAFQYLIYTEANTRRRLQMIAYIDSMDEVGIYGPSAWKDLLPTKKMQNAYRGSIDSREDLLTLYRESKINLCINSLQGFGFVNSRVFDVYSAGGFLLVEWVPLLPELFTQKKDCVWFRSLEELKQLIQTYLASDEMRWEVIQQAQKTMLEAHTYRHRAQTLLEVLDKTV